MSLGEMEVPARQNPCGNGRCSPVGRERMHSPPVERMTLSKRAGPKNQVVNSSHVPVAVIHLRRRERVRVLAGLVSHIAKNAKDVQPQAFLIKYWLTQLDLRAQ